jgi:replicative DNA helicase
LSKVKGNIACERAVLSGLCAFGNDAYADIQDIITGSSFTNESNQIIYKCIIKCLETVDKPDIPSILSAASSLGLQEVVAKDIEFIKTIFTIKVELENVRKFAAKIRKLEAAKDLQFGLEEAHNDLSEVTGDEPIDEIIGIAESPTSGLIETLTAQADNKPILLFEDVDPYIDHLEENKDKAVGISSGYPIYDKVIGRGFRPGYINIIVARPKSGKSTVAKSVAISTSEVYPTLFLDTEMDERVTLNRILADISNNTIDDIEGGKFKSKEKLKKIAEKYKNHKLFYKRIAGKRFEEILSIIRRWVKKEVGVDENGNTNPCLVIYDYFKLMNSSEINSNLSEHQAIGFQLSSLTDFLGNNGVSCLAFVQANREGIDKESTDIISQSDRILWLVSSACLLRRKSREETIEEGAQNGNTKLIPMEAMRFSGGLDEGDWINFQFDKPKSKLIELSTRSQSLKNRSDSGFESTYEPIE